MRNDSLSRKAKDCTPEHGSTNDDERSVAKAVRYFLTTERLGFRCWREGDLDLAVSLWGDPRATRLIDARGQLTREQVRERLEREMCNERELGIQYWPLFRRESHVFIGCCGLKPYDRGQRQYEMGFHLRPDHWGRGFATEAARAVMKFAARRLKPAALLAGHNPENHASKRVLEKLGFRYLRDEYFAGTGVVHPLYELRLGGAVESGL